MTFYDSSNPEHRAARQSVALRLSCDDEWFRGFILRRCIEFVGGLFVGGWLYFGVLPRVAPVIAHLEGWIYK